MTNKKDQQEFSDLILSHVNVSMSSLDEALSWIGANLDPEAIFTTQQLAAWAEGEGYTKE